MEAGESANITQFREVETPMVTSIAEEAKHDVQKKISTGARAVNRLFLSVWFLLLPLICPSSDWIGLVILSQAFLVAVNLIRPASTLDPAAALPECAVLKINDGVGSGKG
jgi:hypothetical protein